MLRYSYIQPFTHCCCFSPLMALGSHATPITTRNLHSNLHLIPTLTYWRPSFLRSLSPRSAPTPPNFPNGVASFLFHEDRLLIISPRTHTFSQPSNLPSRASPYVISLSNSKLPSVVRFLWTLESHASLMINLTCDTKPLVPLTTLTFLHFL